MLGAEQKQLSARFTYLRDTRAHRVFFIEHGLVDTAVEQLNDAVRDAVWRHPPDNSWWQQYPLPLIVCATEVGYRYRGSGTDFWPKLEEALGIAINLDARRNIRNLFEECSHEYRGAQPPATSWAIAFRLIAWPITHALVPQEFHRHLAVTVANLHVNVSAFDDPERLHRAVRLAAGGTSARFATFLENRHMVVSVLRALLGKGDGEISQDTIDRVAADLAADPDARRNIDLAKRAQRQFRTRPAKESDQLPALTGLLQLRLHDNGRLVIEAQFPLLEGPHADRLRRTLRRHRFAPRLWGVASPVPSEKFLSGLPFEVKLTSVPNPDAPPLNGLPEVDIELHGLLKSFQLAFQPPLLFVANSDRDLARAVRGKEISGYREYWLLATGETAATFENLPRLGVVHSFTCFRLAPSESRARKALEHLGYRVRFGISVSFAGVPPLDHYRAVPDFLVGDERIVIPQKVDPSGSYVELNGERVTLHDGLVLVRIPEGEHALEISSEEASRQYRFRGVPEEGISKAYRTCWIDLDAAETTVQALLAGNMALRVDGLAPLEGLALTVELEANGRRRVGTTCSLGPLPQVLLGDHEIWSTLLNKTTREYLLRTPNPVLRARVGALVTESWELQQRLRPYWWVSGPSGFTLDSDDGPLSHGEVSGSAPAARPTPVSAGGSDDVRLLSPLDPDEASFGATAQFTTLCTAPDTLALTTQRTIKPRLRRSRRGDDASLGMEQLVEAWFRWSLAESDSFNAEIRRRQVAAQLDLWLAEVACGENWAKKERLANPLFTDAWTLLADTCREAGQGLDTYVDISPQDENEVIQVAVAEIRRTHPDVWIRISPFAGPDSDALETLLHTEDYEALDAAFESAYQQLAKKYRNAGNKAIAKIIEEADPGSAPGQWDSVLLRVEAASQIGQLAELLLPTDTAKRLTALDVTLMPIEEIGAELQYWARESQPALAGPVPDDSIIKAILALWISPETAVSLDWRIALDTLLAERPLARAARYLALLARNFRVESPG